MSLPPLPLRHPLSPAELKRKVEQLKKQKQRPRIWARGARWQGVDWQTWMSFTSANIYLWWGIWKWATCWQICTMDIFIRIHKCTANVSKVIEY